VADREVLREVVLQFQLVTAGVRVSHGEIGVREAAHDTVGIDVAEAKSTATPAMLVRAGRQLVLSSSWLRCRALRSSAAYWPSTAAAAGRSRRAAKISPVPNWSVVLLLARKDEVEPYLSLLKS
jgi:hypothetical protein